MERMENQFWATEFQWQDLKEPIEDVNGEKVYTLYMHDFLKMPEVNFQEEALFDASLRALLN
jgi:hypothetical protein